MGTATAPSNKGTQPEEIGRERERKMEGGEGGREMESKRDGGMKGRERWRVKEMEG